eukprot:768669-Hanusia_phi.AAC.6
MASDETPRVEKERKKAVRQAMMKKVAGVSSFSFDGMEQEQETVEEGKVKDKEKEEEMAQKEEKVVSESRSVLSFDDSFQLKAKSTYKENKFHARKARQVYSFSRLASDLPSIVLSSLSRLVVSCAALLCSHNSPSDFTVRLQAMRQISKEICEDGVAQALDMETFLQVNLALVHWFRNFVNYPALPPPLRPFTPLSPLPLLPPPRCQLL